MEYFADCTTKEQLKQRYREWTLKLHPDRNPDNQNAAEEFKEMKQQYEERLAELSGDYTKSRQSRERREREAREKAERERQEQARRKVERVVEEARLNRQKSHTILWPGSYLYAQGIKQAVDKADIFKEVMTDDLLQMAVKNGLQDECVVKVEVIVEMPDAEFFKFCYDRHLPEGVWGGYEVLQPADASAGRLKGKRVAKVVMFRSESYCVLGNPMGDQTISDYYLLAGSLHTMFGRQAERIRAKLEHEAAEKARIEAERKAKLLNEQMPLIEEWKEKLIEVSRGLSEKERLTVTIDNIRCMLAHKYVGCRFKVSATNYSEYGITVQWEDGPTREEVLKVLELFSTYSSYGDRTPWMEKYGQFTYMNTERKMSTLTKARILQQLGQVTEAFRNSAMSDDVPLSDFDWLMLHAMAGVDIHAAKRIDLCHCDIHPDGHRTVTPLWAIHFVFSHTSYYRQRKTPKTKNSK